MQKRKNLAIAFSLSNFFLIAQWLRLLVEDRFTYFNPSIPFCAFGAVVAVFCFSVLAFYLILNFADRSKSSWRKAVIYALLMGVFLLSLNKVRTMTDLAVRAPFLSGKALLGTWEKTAAVFFVLFLVLWFYFKFSKFSIVVFRNLLAVLSPLALITFAKLSWTTVQNYSPPPALSSQLKPDRRVVWIVFDEMDQYLAFPGRPSAVQLPEFDRLMRESLHADHAYPPSDSTLRSMPSYLTGKRVKEAHPLSGSELGLAFDGEPEIRSLSKEATLFAKAKELGLKTGLSGWYHPYCRLLKRDLDLCSSEAILQQPYGSSVRANLGLVLRNLLPLSGDPRKTHSAIYQRVLEGALELAGNPNLGLVFLHLPVPHLPRLDQSSGPRFSYPGDPLVEDYFNNLILADRTLGWVRQAIASAGLSDRTHLIVTSDHWWRYAPKTFLASQREPGEHHQVPFMVKLAGEQEGIEYQGAFNAVTSHDIALAILKGEIVKAKEIVAWLRGVTLHPGPKGSGHEEGKRSIPEVRNVAEKPTNVVRLPSCGHAKPTTS
jgi:Sulfatase